MKAILWAVTRFLLIMLPTVLIGGFFLSHTNSITKLTDYLNTYTSQLFLAHYLLISIIIIFWPYVVKATGLYCHWPSELIDKLKNKRLFVFLFFTSFEFIVTQHQLLFHPPL